MAEPTRPLPANWFAGLCLLLFVVAMALYPGSTPFDTTTTHYSLSLNTLSDLGMFYSYRNEALGTTALLFGGALFSAAVATVMFIWNTTKQKIARRYGLAAATCFVCLPFVPSDSILSIHNSLFFGSVIFAAVGLWLAYTKEHRIILAVMALVLILYIGMILILPAAATSPDIRVIHALTQKAVVFFVFGCIIFIPPVQRKHR